MEGGKDRDGETVVEEVDDNGKKRGRSEVRRGWKISAVGTFLRSKKYPRLNLMETCSVIVLLTCHNNVFTDCVYVINCN